MTMLQMFQTFAIGLCFGLTVGNFINEQYGVALMWFGLMIFNAVARGLNS